MSENEGKIIEELESIMREKDPKFTKLKLVNSVAMFFIRKIASLQDQVDELKKQNK